MDKRSVAQIFDKSREKSAYVVTSPRCHFYPAPREWNGITGMGCDGICSVTGTGPVMLIRIAPKDTCHLPLTTFNVRQCFRIEIRIGICMRMLAV